MTDDDQPGRDASAVPAAEPAARPGTEPSTPQGSSSPEPALPAGSAEPDDDPMVSASVDPEAGATVAPHTAATVDPAAEAADPPTDAAAGSYRQRRRARRAAKKARPRRKAPWWELPALVVLAILIAIVVKTFVVQPFYIPSQSMEKTLHGCPGCHGDRILVNKPIFDFRDPHPGDIVVFDAPRGWDDEPVSKPPSNPVVRTVRGFGQLIGFIPPDGQVLVKRVIAVGGQTVKGDTTGHVMVSTHGAAGPFRTLREPYVYVDSAGGGQRSFGPVTVPKGRVWVMGDHRNDSADSRYHCGINGTDTPDDSDCDPHSSTVPISDVIGKAFVIAWPPSRWRTLGTPATFESAASALATPVVPSAVSVATVVPLFLIRRRRRRRPRSG